MYLSYKHIQPALLLVLSLCYAKEVQFIFCSRLHMQHSHLRQGYSSPSGMQSCFHLTAVFLMTPAPLHAQETLMIVIQFTVMALSYLH